PGPQRGGRGLAGRDTGGAVHGADPHLQLADQLVADGAQARMGVDTLDRQLDGPVQDLGRQPGQPVHDLAGQVHVVVIHPGQYVHGVAPVQGGQPQAARRVEVDAAGGGQVVPPAALAPVARWGDRVGLCERPGERVGRGVAGLDADPGHRQAGGHQLVGGPFQQQSAAERARWLAQRRAGQPVEVEPRQAGPAGQLGGVQAGLVEALLDQRDDLPQLRHAAILPRPPGRRPDRSCSITAGHGAWRPDAGSIRSTYRSRGCRGSMTCDQPATAGSWPARRLFPLLATAGLLVVGMASTVWWGPALVGKTNWSLPHDLWGTLIAAQRLVHGDLAGLYTRPTGLVSLPGAAVILVPVVLAAHAAGLSLRVPGPHLAHPGAWLLLGPYAIAASATALFAADALAEHLGVSRPRRAVLAGANAVGVWSVSARWGHPEDAVAVALLVAGLLALARDRPGRAAWLAGAAIAVQPLVLLALPVLLAAMPARR